MGFSMGFLVGIFGVLILSHAAYATIQYRSVLKIMEEEFSGPPFTIRLRIERVSMTEQAFDETKSVQEQKQQEVEDPELYQLLVPNVEDLPVVPPSAIESNFVSYFAPAFMILMIVPLLYESLEDTVDNFAEIAMNEMKKQYDVLDEKVLQSLKKKVISYKNSKQH